jgi:hypothetical protein
MVRAIGEVATRVKAESWRVIKIPVVTQLEQKSRINLLYRRFKLVTGRSWNSVPVKESEEQVRPELNRSPLR